MKPHEKTLSPPRMPVNPLASMLTPNNTWEQFEEYKKVYLTAFILHQENMRLKTKFHGLIETVDKADTQLRVREGTRHPAGRDVSASEEQYKKSRTNTEKLKRSRRKAEQISRIWECNEPCCGRNYGAHASLLQHVKLKHPEAYCKYSSD